MISYHTEVSEAPKRGHKGVHGCLAETEIPFPNSSILQKAGFLYRLLRGGAFRLQVRQSWQGRYGLRQCSRGVLIERLRESEGLNRCAVLEELFKALLHKLMTGDIRVRELSFAGMMEEG